VFWNTVEATEITLFTREKKETTYPFSRPLRVLLPKGASIRFEKIDG